MIPLVPLSRVLPVIAVAWSSVVVGCDPPAPLLVVDLLTDYRAGIEFDRVEVELFPGTTLAALDIPARAAAPAMVQRHDGPVGGTRVAEVTGLPPGSWLVQVRLKLGPADVAENVTLVDFGRTTKAITVRITRECGEAECPGDGSLSEFACLAGRCVDPRCSPESPASCPRPDCELDPECESASTVDCMLGLCLSGVCGRWPDDSRCSDRERCVPDVGCRPLDAGPLDAGPPDGGGVEIDCSDGLDDDGDGEVDCADLDCAGIGCDSFGRTCSTGVCGCPGGSVEDLCGDGIDQDCDGLVDCLDPDCDARACDARGRLCSMSACTCTGGSRESSCANGSDDDCDGDTDCDDMDCAGRACGALGFVCGAGGCACGGTAEDCTNGIDDDCDGDTDCDDSECAAQSCGPGGRTCIAGGRCGWTGFNCAACPSGYTQRAECGNHFACTRPTGTIGRYFFDGSWRNDGNDCATCNRGGGLDWEVWER